MTAYVTNTITKPDRPCMMETSSPPLPGADLVPVASGSPVCVERDRCPKRPGSSSALASTSRISFAARRHRTARSMACVDRDEISIVSQAPPHPPATLVSRRISRDKPPGTSRPPRSPPHQQQRSSRNAEFGQSAAAAARAQSLEFLCC